MKKKTILIITTSLHHQLYKKKKIKIKFNVQDHIKNAQKCSKFNVLGVQDSLLMYLLIKYSPASNRARVFSCTWKVMSGKALHFP